MSVSVASAQARSEPERVVVINDASVARGGATGLANLSIRLMRARGLAVTLICGDAGANEDLSDLGVEVIALGQERLLSAGKIKAMRAGLHNGAARDLVTRFIQTRDTARTIYHVHGWAQILSPALFLALRPVAPRVITHAHDMFLACPNGVYMDFKAGAACTRTPLSLDCWKTHCDKRSYPEKLWRATRTRGLKSAFDQRLDWGPVALIHPAMEQMLARGGLEPQRLTVVRNPAAAWSDTRIPAEQNAPFLFVGRVERDKGVDVLAEAAKLAGVKAIFVGDGPRRAPLMEAYPEFDFPGWLRKPEIGTYAAQARALVMPSLHPEPFGLVAAEASMSGLPVILSNSALLANDIRESDLGFAYDAARPETLAAALTKIAELSETALAEMSKRAFAQAMPLAQSQDDWMDMLIGLYSEMLKRVGPDRNLEAPISA